VTLATVKAQDTWRRQTA